MALTSPGQQVLPVPCSAPPMRSVPPAPLGLPVLPMLSGLPRLPVAYRCSGLSTRLLEIAWIRAVLLTMLLLSAVLQPRMPA